MLIKPPSRIPSEKERDLRKVLPRRIKPRTTQFVISSLR